MPPEKVRTWRARARERPTVSSTRAIRERSMRRRRATKSSTSSRARVAEGRLLRQVAAQRARRDRLAHHVVTADRWRALTKGTSPSRQRRMLVLPEPFGPVERDRLALTRR